MPNALVSHARRLLRSGHVVQAEAELRQAHEQPEHRFAAEIELAYLDLLHYRAPSEIIRRIDIWLARNDVSPLLKARCLFVKGVAENRMGRAARAIDALTDAATICLAGRFWAALAEVTDGLGTVYVWRGRHDDAARAFLRALGYWTKATDSLGALTTLANVGRMHLEAGRYSEALTFFNMATEQGADGLGSRELLRLQLNSVQALLGNAQTAEALEQASAARNAAQQFGSKRLEWLAQFELTRCFIQGQQHDKAETALEELAQKTPPDETSFERAACNLVHGSHLVQTAPDKAVPYLERALQHFVEDDLAAPEVEARLYLGDCLRRQGDLRRSEKCFLIAMTRARERRLMMLLERAQRALLQFGIDEADALENSGGFAPDIASGELPYVIRERLSSGGFSTAYRAYDPERGREIVLKTSKLSQEYDSSRRIDLIASVRTELEALSRVRHPGIVRVYGAGEAPNGDLYIIEEFIDAGSLRDSMQRTGDTAQICEILAKIAFALDAVHRAKIVHRDLKPENILMREPISPVLIDFGIAQIRTADADPFVGVGTGSYMAPEQRALGTVDAAADLYALGVIAFEWLTGTLPTTRTIGSPKKRRGIFGNKGSSSLQTHRPDIPPKIADLVNSLLAEEPYDRPRSAKAAARSFLQMLEDA